MRKLVRAYTAATRDPVLCEAGVAATLLKGRFSMTLDESWALDAVEFILRANGVEVQLIGEFVGCVFGIDDPGILVPLGTPVRSPLAVFLPVRTLFLLRDHRNDRRPGSNDAGEDGEDDFAVARIHPSARADRGDEHRQTHEHGKQKNRNNAPKNRIGAFEKQRRQHDHNGGYQSGDRIFHGLRFPDTWEFRRHSGRVRTGDSAVNRIFAVPCAAGWRSWMVPGRRGPSGRRGKDSNLRPLPCRGSALPLSYPPTVADSLSHRHLRVNLSIGRKCGRAQTTWPGFLCRLATAKSTYGTHVRIITNKNPSIQLVYGWNIHVLFR